MTEPTPTAGLPRHWTENPHVCGADCAAAADRIWAALDEPEVVAAAAELNPPASPLTRFGPTEYRR